MSGWSHPLEGVVDFGDISFGEGSLEDALGKIYQMVVALPRGVAPCVIGGDHTLTLPTVRALAERNTRPFYVVQFDQHLDIQLWDGSISDTSSSPGPIFNTSVMSHVSKIVGPNKLIQIGVSPFVTVEHSERSNLKGFLGKIGTQIPLTSHFMEDLTGQILSMPPGSDCYMSIDVDVLSSQDMTSTSYPAEIGLSARELLSSIDQILSRHRLIGFDVVEFAADRNARDPKVLSDAGRAKNIFLHLLSKVHRDTNHCKD